MKPSRFFAAFFLLAATAIASVAHSSVVCTQSKKIGLLIDSEKNQILIKNWGDVVATLPIVKVDRRYLEVYPPLWETTYALEGGFRLVTSFESREEKGKGLLIYKAGQIADYDCSKQDDI